MHFNITTTEPINTYQAKNTYQTKPVPLVEMGIQSGSNVCVLAPHPDDFDAISVTLRELKHLGCNLSLGVLTDGANGVSTGFSNARTRNQKVAVRREEQLSACDFFGIDRELVSFFDLEKNSEGILAVTENNTRTVRNVLTAADADIVFLPHGNDSNMTHQRVFALYNRAVRNVERPHKALLNCDVKTRQMMHHVYTPFDETVASWKSELLRHHRSQQQRNLDQRGYGLDQRILQMNNTLALDLNLPDKYAESFELAYHRGTIE